MGGHERYFKITNNFERKNVFISDENVSDDNFSRRIK